MDREEITIFVGSPGDVQEERDLVFELIDGINQDPGLEPYFHLKGIGWDRTPYFSNTWLSPQRAIASELPLPANCNIAVFIFWSRVGTPLDPDEFDDIDPASYGFLNLPVTGSTWEFLNALTAVEEQQRPLMLTFRCERPYPPPTDSNESKEQAKQLEGLEALFDGFKARESFRYSYTGYTQPTDLRKQLNVQLRAYLEKRRKVPLTAATPNVPRPTPKRRRVQLDWLAALLGKLKQRPTAKDRIDTAEGGAVPLIVSGVEAEWHEALARQLKALVTNYDPALSKPVPIPGWHDNTDLRLRKLNLTNELREHIGLEPLGRSEAKTDAELLIGISAQLHRLEDEVFHYRLFADRWADNELDLIRWWMDFWLALKLSRKGQKICALLSIEVFERKGFFQRLLTKNTAAKSVESAFDILGKDVRYAPYLLSKLQSPTKICAREWSENQLAKVPDIEIERDAYITACDALFNMHDVIPHKKFRDDWIKQLTVSGR